MKTLSMKAISGLALSLLLLSGVTACTNKPMNSQNSETQGSNGGGGMGGGSSGGSSGGGGGRY
jgi:hypothetical protein